MVVSGRLRALSTGINFPVLESRPLRLVSGFFLTIIISPSLCRLCGHRRLKPEPPFPGNQLEVDGAQRKTFAFLFWDYLNTKHSISLIEDDLSNEIYGQYPAILFCFGISLLRKRRLNKKLCSYVISQLLQLVPYFAFPLIVILLPSVLPIKKRRWGEQIFVPPLWQSLMWLLSHLVGLLFKDILLAP